MRPAMPGASMTRPSAATGWPQPSSIGAGTRAWRWWPGARRRCRPPAERQETAVATDPGQLLLLGRGVPALWHHPDASAAIRERILRTVLREAVVTISEGKTRFLLHWQGGGLPSASVAACTLVLRPPRERPSP